MNSIRDSMFKLEMNFVAYAVGTRNVFCIRIRACVIVTSVLIVGSALQLENFTNSCMFCRLISSVNCGGYVTSS